MAVDKQGLTLVVAPSAPSVQVRHLCLSWLTSSYIYGMWQSIWPTYAFTASPQVSVNFPVYHSIIQRDLALLDSLWSDTLVHSIGNSILIRPDKQDVVGVLEASVEYVCCRDRREVWACWVTSKASVAYRATYLFTIRKEAQLPWVWGQHRQQ